MFNRFKNFNLDNFLDSKIAEEQARQKQGQPGVPRRQPSGARRANGRNDSPSKRPSSRTRDGTADGQPPSKGPDPSDFVIEEDEVSSRVATPRPLEHGDEQKPDTTKLTAGEERTESSAGPKAEASHAAGKELQLDEHRDVLPQDVQLRLRRLQKLESKYGELLRSYRVAHARVSAIEPFEASLRENTPLTSINEPSALVEYLAQVNLKGDMIMGELKKVTEERNNIKIKLDETEKEMKMSTKASKGASEREASQSESKAEGDDFFSYESEIPRLQNELQEQVGKIDELMQENEKLRNELDAVRASQNNNDGVHREAEKGEMVMQQDAEELEALHSQAATFSKIVQEVETVIQTLEDQLQMDRASDTSTVSRLRRISERIVASRAEQVDVHDSIQDLKEKLNKAETDAVRAKEDAARHQQEATSSQRDGQKRCETLDMLAKTLRKQLAEAEESKLGLQKELEDIQKQWAEPRTQSISSPQEHSLADNAEIETIRIDNARMRKEIELVHDIISKASSVEAVEKGTLPVPPQGDGGVEPVSDTGKIDNGAAKKKSKNKKKKKGVVSTSVPKEKPETERAKIANAQSESEPVSISSPERGRLDLEQLTLLRDRIAEVATSHAACDHTIQKLKIELEQAEVGITEKSDTIDQLTSRLKGEEDLREEIEGLKDDLMHIGNEHVGAKDQVKQLKEKNDKLSVQYDEQIQRLERDLDAAKERTVSMEKSLSSQAEEKSKLDAQMKLLGSGDGSSTAELERRLATTGAEKSALQARLDTLAQEKKEIEGTVEELRSEIALRKEEADSTKADLKAANELAQGRFKELSALRDRMNKIQPEVNNLRSEAERLKTSNEELNRENTKLKDLEARLDVSVSETKELKLNMRSKEIEVKALSEKLVKANERMNELEEKEGQATKASQKAEALEKEAVEARERTVKDLNKAKDELSSARKQLAGTEVEVARLRTEVEGAREEMQLKAAQQASAQSLMDSMSDQTRELATQMKELRSRCDSLEEELADSQRLLMERSREGETMRRLLGDVEGRAEAKVKEMRERMDLAIEERDRAEEDASAVTRRRAREVDELRAKLKMTERGRDAAVDEKGELERRLQDLIVGRERLEGRLVDSQKEMEEVKKAMTQLRDSLDLGEQQLRDLQRERNELRRAVEDKERRLEKVTKGSKTMAEELKGLQAVKARQLGGTPSNRSSMDSNRVTSPTNTGSVNGSGGKADTDYVYLKTVLLQFLEQKDKKHQMQLVPVLGMLLHFDRRDEQKWMTAINAK